MKGAKIGFLKCEMMQFMLSERVLSLQTRICEVTLGSVLKMLHVDS